jgi:hypothetical protein
MLCIPPFLKSCFGEDGSKDSFNSLGFLKDLRFTAPIHRYVNDRCAYTSFWGLYYGLEIPRDEEEEEEDHDDDHDGDGEAIHDAFLGILADRLNYVFSQLTDNTLRRFR